jgi:hypothetical protein
MRREIQRKGQNCKNPMQRFFYLKDSAVALSASIMLLAAGFFGSSPSPAQPLLASS